MTSSTGDSTTAGSKRTHDTMSAVIDLATSKGATELGKKTGRKVVTPRPKSTRTTKGKRDIQPPALSAIGPKAGREGACGFFSRSREWYVANPVRGFIIQKITRTFSVEWYDTSKGSWQALTGGAIDKYVTDPDSSVDADSTEYWELWEVNDEGRIIHNRDTFALCSILPTATTPPVNTTKGTFTITGTASFYPASEEVSAGDLGFTSGGAAPAGMLLSRTDDPAGDLTTHKVKATGAAVTCTARCVWDSTTGSDPTSKVTMS